MARPLALVTGSTSGIGRASALRLAALGFDVIAHRRDAEDDLESLAAEALGHDAKLHPVVADFSDEGAVDALRDQIAAVLDGRTVDVALLNAGVAPFGDARRLDARGLRRVLQINTVAPYELAAHLTDVLTPQRGRLLFIGSGLTRYAYPELTGYGMSKIALQYLSLNLAVQLGPRGITVNVLAPGVVDTDLNASWLRDNDEAAAATRATSAVRKIATPTDIAEVVGALATTTTAAVTGQVIDVSMGTNL